MEKNILFVSLGCDKNLVDTEEMLGDLSGTYSFTDDEEQADIAVVNTCCFIDDAKQESIDNILELAERRRNGQLRALVVTGCMAQRYKEEIIEEIPEVDAVIGTTAEDSLADTIAEVIGESPREESRVRVGDATAKLRTGKRVMTTGGWYSYLRIADGCDKYCTYCIIPSIRGHYRSVPMEDLVAEAKELAGQGVKELILVAQETTLYGTDLYGKKMLPELLHRLAQVEGIEWIRLLYCYPEEITRELVQTIKEEPRVLHYLDMPIQHASDAVLRKMNRRTTQAELEEIIGYLRQEIPDICLRTTLISGFPGERQTDHETLLDFVHRMHFDRLGVFTYSREEGTPAAEFSPQVPEALAQKRMEDLMILQQGIAFEQAQEMEGQVVQALVEGKLVGENVYAARTYKDAPGVDGMLFIETQHELMTGDIVPVVITGSQDYDLIGKLAPTR